MQPSIYFPSTWWELLILGICIVGISILIHILLWNAKAKIKIPVHVLIIILVVCVFMWFMFWWIGYWLLVCIVVIVGLYFSIKHKIWHKIPGSLKITFDVSKAAKNTWSVLKFLVCVTLIALAIWIAYVYRSEIKSFVFRERASEATHITLPQPPTYMNKGTHVFKTGEVKHYYRALNVKHYFYPAEPGRSITLRHVSILNPSSHWDVRIYRPQTGPIRPEDCEIFNNTYDGKEGPFSVALLSEDISLIYSNKKYEP